MNNPDYILAASEVIQSLCDNLSQVVRESTSDAINHLCDDAQETVGTQILARERYLHRELTHIQQLAQSMVYS